MSGDDYSPHGVAFLAGKDTIVVADGKNSRLLLLAPVDGTLKQVVALGAEIGDVHEICVHGNCIVLLHVRSRNVCLVSYFAFK